LLWIFPVIYSWSFVHHSSMLRVVDVLYAVSYTVAEYEWSFSSLLWIFFPVCHGLHRTVVWVIRGVTCRLSFFLSITDLIFSWHLLLGICASDQYVQSSWRAMCC